MYPPTTKPSYIQFYPTLNCNYACSFCFNRNLPGIKDVDVHDFQHILSALKSLKVDHIDMLGGEPSLHPELLQLIGYINQYEMQTTVSSNGTKVDILTAISKTYPPKKVKIGISLNAETLSDELHAYITTFKPLLKSVYSTERLISESCQAYLDIPDIEYYLLYLDIIEPDDFKHGMPFYEFYNDLLKLKKRFANLNGVFCSGFIPDVSRYPELEFVRCPAGTTKLSLFPNGDLYPCYLFFRFPEFRLGNLLVDDFDAIWQNPALNHFRSFKINQCPQTACPLFQVCHGGCPALSYIFYRKLDAPDPRCVHQE